MYRDTKYHCFPPFVCTLVPVHHLRNGGRAPTAPGHPKQAFVCLLLVNRNVSFQGKVGGFEMLTEQDSVALKVTKSTRLRALLTQAASNCWGEGTLMQLPASNKGILQMQLPGCSLGVPLCWGGYFSGSLLFSHISGCSNPSPYAFVSYPNRLIGSWYLSWVKSLLIYLECDQGPLWSG